MKIRTGFVSNSSTSSFVILGARLSQKEYDNLEKKLVKDDDEDLCDWLDNNDYFHDGEGTGHLIGIEIASQYSDDYELEESSMTLEELTKIGKQVEELLNKKSCLFTGTRMC